MLAQRMEHFLGTSRFYFDPTWTVSHSTMDHVILNFRMGTRSSRLQLVLGSQRVAFIASDLKFEPDRLLGLSSLLFLLVASCCGNI